MPDIEKSPNRGRSPHIPKVGSNLLADHRAGRQARAPSDIAVAGQRH